MSRPTHTDGCGSDVAAYALGALPDEETKRFEAHLETCDLCRTDLAALKPVVDALPGAAEPVQPPPALKKRIMSVVEAEARERHAVERPKRRWTLSFRPLPAMAAACVLLAVGIGIGVATLGDDDATIIQGQCMRGCDRVEMRLDEGRGTLELDGMPQPPAGRVYQLWTQRGSEPPKPTDALFTVDEDGSASVVVPGDTTAVDQVLATDEPPNGSDKPTSSPYFAVRMS